MLAKSATGSSKTVDEMIEITDSALYSDLMTIAMLYAQDADLLDHISEVQPPSTDPETILNQLQIAILDEFPEPVSTEFNIKYVHESLEENLSPAFYMVPAIDATDSNTIYINNYSVGQQDAMYLYSTLAHEGYPGHLYEATWFNSTNPHPIRKLLNYSGYSEAGPLMWKCALSGGPAMTMPLPKHSGPTRISRLASAPGGIWRSITKAGAAKIRKTIWHSTAWAMTNLSTGFMTRCRTFQLPLLLYRLSGI